MIMLSNIINEIIFIVSKANIRLMKPTHLPKYSINLTKEIQPNEHN